MGSETLAFLGETKLGVLSLPPAKLLGLRHGPPS